MFIHLEVFRG